MEKIAIILIYLHAVFGGIALFAGATALVVKKGGLLHRRSGNIFFYSMLVSALVSLIVAVLPNHQNPFLFSIGLFSTYFLLSGYRGLRFREKDLVLEIDKIISSTVIFVGAAMVLVPVMVNGSIAIVLFVFGTAAIIFGIRDLKMFKDRERLRRQWLRIHLGKMTGAYIAAVSAFLVVNDFLPGLLNWFLPTILGSVYITYWMLKIKRETPSTKNRIT